MCSTRTPSRGLESQAYYVSLPCDGHKRNCSEYQWQQYPSPAGKELSVTSTLAVSSAGGSRTVTVTQLQQLTGRLQLLLVVGCHSELVLLVRNVLEVVESTVETKVDTNSSG